MADYDGSVRFDTQINTKNASSQLLRLENQISKAARKASDLTEKMREMESRPPQQMLIEICKTI